MPGDQLFIEESMVFTYSPEAHLLSRRVCYIEVNRRIQGMDRDFLASKNERHVDLSVTRYFPNSSNVRSIGELSTGNPTIHSGGQGPRCLISIKTRMNIRNTYSGT